LIKKLIFFSCKTKKYLKNLPQVSIIIVYHNEILSMLLRCIHSVYNRSPHHLVHEIILVDDDSTFPELKENLTNYLDGKFDNKVKWHLNEQREGLIRARMIGARLAEAEVIVFLDSHMEVTNNWLPPILDPLVQNPTFVIVPIIEGLNHATFEYEYIGNGYRGTFDWNFRYQWFPLRPQDRPDLGENFELSSMTGGAFTMYKSHFFYLGGYDEKLKIWNGKRYNIKFDEILLSYILIFTGENYELSLKLWLCSGGILQVPCSRVIHLSKTKTAYRKSPDGSDFSAYNLKRIAEVWLDDYKKYLYRGDLQRYAKIDAGDLTKQFELKERLKCKPFKYFLDNIATEMLIRYPLEPQYYATGSLQSQESMKCMVLTESKYREVPSLVECNSDLAKPAGDSDFVLTFEKSIKFNDTNDQCLNSEKVAFENCNHQGYQQHWVYKLETKQIYNPYKRKCLDTNDHLVSVASCDENLLSQKWNWGIVNMTALVNWNSTGITYGPQ
jgi:polypeptide N-acetylgalactosaminyltransferase